MKDFRAHGGGFWALLMVCGMMVSCGHLAENAAEKAIEHEAEAQGQDVDMDIDREDDGSMKMTFKGENGEEVQWEVDEEQMSWNTKDENGEDRVVIGQNTALPESFPEDVPLYPEMTIMMTQAGSRAAQFSIHATSTDSVQKILTFYADAVAKAGWAPHPEMSEMNMGGVQQRLYQKGERTLHLTVASDGTQAMVTINTEETP